MKKIILYLLILFSSFTFSFAYEVDIPDMTSSKDIDVKSTTIEVDEESYTKISEIINRFLWIFTGTVALGVVLYAGFLLVSSTGDSNDMKKANKMLIWGIVGIFVSLLAYTIVNLLIKLF